MLLLLGAFLVLPVCIRAVKPRRRRHSRSDGHGQERARARARRAIRRRDHQLRFDGRLSRLRHRHRQGAARRAARHSASSDRHRRSDRGVHGRAVRARRGRERFARFTRAAGCRFVVGGTGFYYRALTRGLFPGPGRDAALARAARVDRRAARTSRSCIACCGASILRRPTRIQPRDLKRIVRALEVFFLTGRPLTAHFADTVSPIPDVDDRRRSRCGCRRP